MSSHPPSAAAVPPVSWPDDTRRVAFERWLATLGHRGLRPETLRPASADASFRRYLRIDSAEGSRIVMDAPPSHEDCRPFVAIAAQLQQAGLNGPEVLEWNEADGFLLLSDLGQELFLGRLQQAQRDGDIKLASVLMLDAIEALVQWQQRIDASALPPYDDALLRRELALFPDWAVTRELGVSWNDTEQARWQAGCDLLVRSALAQPTVAVHRDYMPRNLMLSRPNPGILDFQDAVNGPVSYDIACLLRDAFISWDEEQEIDWAVRYWERARRQSLPVAEDFGEFWRQIEWMGLQRHLKVIGIFCRLKHRDGKPHYAEDLPRFFRYAHRVCSRYTSLAPLGALLEPLAGLRREVGYTF